MKLIVILALLIGTIWAENSFDRILITKTTKKSALKSIKQKLDALRVKMFVQKISTGYYVYSDKFFDKDKSKMVLKNIKTRFPYAKIVTVSGSNSKDAIDPSSNSTQKNKNKKNFYISLAAGNASTSGSTNSDEASQLENSGLSYSLDGGYYLEDYLYASIGYLDTSTDDITMNNYYSSINYNYNVVGKLDIYTGILLGYSSLKVGEPFNSSASTALLYGAQLGTSYNFFNTIKLFCAYQFLMADHSINVTDLTENENYKIEFSSTGNISLGVGYRF